MTGRLLIWSDANKASHLYGGPCLAKSLFQFLNWLDDENGAEGFSAVDKVVGSAAAFLYV